MMRHQSAGEVEVYLHCTVSHDNTLHISAAFCSSFLAATELMTSEKVDL